MNDVVKIAIIVAGFALGVVAMWRGIPLNVAGMQLNAVRSDVVTVSAKESAQLIKENASERTILLVPRDEEGRARFSACSEPPPDVAQNLVQSVNASLDAIAKRGSELEANVAAKMTSDLKSAAEQIFQRSQGIQLLRDTMFRLCEGLQNGVLGRDEYRTLIQSLITTANFIIPFEQCTGMVRSNQTLLNTDTIQVLMKLCFTAAVSFSEMQRPDRDLKAGTSTGVALPVPPPQAKR